MKLTRTVRSVALAAAALVVGAAGVGLVGNAPASYAEVTNLNPVRVPVDDHPANSGFLVFVEQDVNLEGNESEGTMAMGGNLTINGTYNIAAGAPPVFETPTAEGDDGPIYLYVGGGVDLSNAGTVFVERGGFTKIRDTSTYDAYNFDNNGAEVSYRIVGEGEPYNTSGGFIDGRTHAQTPESIETPAADLLDVEDAFTTYRQITQDLAACASTVELTDAQGNPLGPIVTPGTQGHITLHEGVTNVLEISAIELANLAELTYETAPSADTPLLINVTGGPFVGDFPNSAGIGGDRAPYVLWNFPDAQQVTVTGGGTAEGTLYAPNADLEWLSASNIEGNVIAANFSHGGTATAADEIHDFPFQAELTCTDGPPPTTTTTPSVPTTTTTEPTTTEPTTTEPTTTEPTTTEPTTTEPTTEPTTTAPTTTGPTTGTVPPVTVTRTSSSSPGFVVGGSGGDGLADTGGGPLGWLVLGGAAALAAGAAMVAAGVTRRREAD